MKHLIKAGTTIISTMIILSGCTVSDMQTLTSGGDAVSVTPEKHAAISENKVKVYYSNNSLPKHYKMIGRVSASNDNMVGVPHSQESIADNLKKQAASIGANGVIHIQTGLEQTTGDAILSY